MSNLIPFNTARKTPDAKSGGATRKSKSQAHRLDMQDYVELSELIDRRLMHLLTPAEFMVLRFILDRTYGWNNPSERVSMRQLMGGSRDKSGEHAFFGTGLSRAHLIRVLAKLCDDGILVRERLGTDAYEYVINGAAHAAFFELRMIRKREGRKTSE